MKLRYYCQKLTHPRSNKLSQFLNFVGNLQLNFLSVNNYLNSEKNEGPYCGGWNRLVQRENLQFANNLIIRQQPNQNSQGNIYSCMDIILFNQNVAVFFYNLEFDVIGRINLLENKVNINYKQSIL